MVDGVFLGMMTAVGFAVIYKRLHPKVQIFMQQHPLFTDVVLMVLFYQVMGMTITAHFACAAMGILAMAGLHIERHKEDFMFLYDAVDVAKAKVGGWLNTLRQNAAKMNAAHKAKMLNAQALTVAEHTEC